jgi:hydroxyacylglutathione hydrolase
MYFEQFYLGCLAHASYMVGSEGVAAVVDPQRDVEIYLEAARQNNLRIAYVIETHLHADFVSGHRELAARTGAEDLRGRAGRRAVSARSRPARAMRSASGSAACGFSKRPAIRWKASACWSRTWTARRNLSRCSPAIRCSSAMWAGRISRRITRPSSSPGCCTTACIRSYLSLPDDLRVYPAHGAGSLCGRQMSASVLPPSASSV